MSQPAHPAHIVTVGPHRLAVGDLTKGAAAAALDGDVPDITYTDPPWGLGNLHYWRNQAGAGPSDGWGTFLEEFVQLVKPTRRDVFVEMGVRWMPELQALLEAEGARTLAVWDVVYPSGGKHHPSKLWWGTFTGRHGTAADPTGLTGLKVLTATALAVRRDGDHIFDPCMGVGRYAAHFIKGGYARFTGCEINPKRFDRAVAAVTAAHR